MWLQVPLSTDSPSVVTAPRKPPGIVEIHAYESFSEPSEPNILTHSAHTMITSSASSAVPVYRPPSTLRCSVVTTGGDNWFLPFAQLLVERLAPIADTSLVFSHSNLRASDIVFYLSYYSIVPEDALAISGNNVVAHASDLPSGRGCAPMTWQVLEGRDKLTLTLFEATREVDAGPIYLQESLELDGTELVNEIRAAVGKLTIAMCLHFVENRTELMKSEVNQTGVPTYYPRRTPADSELDPNKTITEQFNLLRVVDNDRYPAFFELSGRRYRLSIEAFDG